MSTPRLDVLHVGSASRDLTRDDPRGWRLGGGVTYAALTTARLGLRTGAIVGVDDPAAEARELDDLRAAGVDLLLVRLREGPVFENIERPSGRIQQCIAPGVPLPLPALPESWSRAAAWSIVPVAGEIGEAWATFVPPTAVLALGWQGFLRRLAAGEQVARRPPGPNALLARADLVGVSHHDVDPATPIAELTARLHDDAHLLITRGHQGGLLVEVRDGRPAGVLRYLPTHTDRELDATGAGDTFLAALLASALRPAIAGRRRSRRPYDLRFAAAAGSLAVEGIGLEGVPDRAAVNIRRARERLRRAVVPSADSQVGSLTAGAID
jgi:sugar/nucleoside kinase (ribokinase family)